MKVCLSWTSELHDPFARLVSQLFSAAHQPHTSSIPLVLFHNCIYEEVYRHAHLKDGMSTVELMRWLQPETRLIVVGDARCFYELVSVYGAIDYWHQNETSGLDWLKRLDGHFNGTLAKPHSKALLGSSYNPHGL